MSLKNFLKDNSDHKSILLSLKWSRQPSRRTWCTIWCYSRANWDAIRQDLSTFPTPTDDINSYWSAWKSHFLSVFTLLTNRLSSGEPSLGSQKTWSNCFARGMHVMLPWRQHRLAHWAWCLSFGHSETKQFLLSEKPKRSSIKTSVEICVLPKIFGPFTILSLPAGRESPIS